VAASAEGETVGGIKSFSTDYPPPAATTGTAINITTTSATLLGTVNPNGFSTEAWFEYSLDNTFAPSTFNTTTPKNQGSGTTTLDVSEAITSLTPWRTWYFRTVARSIADPSIFTKGAIHSFPTGEYYVAVGDSITAGSGDDIPSDDVSLDGRNSGGGFEPILNNLLTAAKGYPHTVVNAGFSGDTSAVGVSRIGGLLSGNPSAKYFLILYGTNDASVPVPKATYKSNMQAIITAIKNAGKVPYLAKVPFTTDLLRSDLAIRDYNAAIDELRISNSISVVAPNFYSWFQSHQSELDDGIHPNGTGYQSMANLWFNALP
jgi:lysophospholipase L1-like esterase